MTVDEVKARVEEIRNMAGDDEAAHGMEDKLHQDVLRAIANRECPNPARLAYRALETKEIDFSRWCA
jgi:hypothetical protein